MRIVQQFAVPIRTERVRIQIPKDAEILDAIYDERDAAFTVVMSIHPEAWRTDRHNIRDFVTVVSGEQVGYSLRECPEHIKSAARGNGLLFHLFEMKNISGGA